MDFPPCGGHTPGEGETLRAVSIAYFRNLKGDQPIDDLQGLSFPGVDQLKPLENAGDIRGLDYSLQLSFGISNFCNHWTQRPEAERSAEIDEVCGFGEPDATAAPDAPEPPGSADALKTVVKDVGQRLQRQSR